MQIERATRRTCLVAACAAITAAHATDVNFDDKAQWSNAEDFVSDGYQFVATSPQHVQLTAIQVCSPACPLSGSMELLAPLGPVIITMRSANGMAFGLDSFLGAGTFDFNDNGQAGYLPRNIVVTGHLAAGGVVTESFALATSGSGPLPFTLMSLDPSFVGLSSVTFRSTGASDQIFDGFTLDDIEVSTVAEPSSLGMLVASLVALGTFVRRGRATGPAGARRTHVALE